MMNFFNLAFCVHLLPLRDQLLHITQVIYGTTAVYIRPSSISLSLEDQEDTVPG